jgi:hypothetical protein
MTLFVEVRTLSGASYIRAPDVIAVQFVDTQKSTVLMAGGTNLSVAEPAKLVMARIEAALQQTSETPHGHGSR